MTSKQTIEDLENIDETLQNEMVLSGPEIDENKDQSSQRAGSIEDDDMELRWEDDDIDDISVTNEAALLEEVAMEDEDDNLPTEPKKIFDVSHTRNTEEGSSYKYIDKTFEPAKAHGLNKPDMMLEILTQDLSDLSDDEDLTNLKMSPDLEIEACNVDQSSEILIHEKNVNRQNDFGEEEQSNDSLLGKNIVSGSVKDFNIELSEEGNLAADLLRKELAMEIDNEDMAVTLEDEDLLLRDDIENEQEDDPIVELDLNEEDINLDTTKVPENQSKEEISKTIEKDNLLKPLSDLEIKVDLTVDKDVIDITLSEEAKSLEKDIEREIAAMTEAVESAYMKNKKNPISENVDPDELNSSKVSKKLDLAKEVSKNADTEQLEVQDLSSKSENLINKKLSLKLSMNMEVDPTSLELDKDSPKVQSPLMSESKEANKIDNFIADPQPSTSGLGRNVINSNKESLEKIKDIEPQPCTSNQNVSLFSSSIQDIEDVPGPSDSLGLLSESSRIMGDEEVEDEDLEEEEGDDFEHFDESSNQMTAEHSEDSNQHHSDDVNETPNQTPTIEKDFNFTITGVKTETAVDKMDSEEKETSNEKNDIDLQANQSKIEDDKEKNTNNPEDIINKETETIDETKDETKITKSKDTSYVVLEESSAEEDAQESKNQNMKTAEGTEKGQDKSLNKDDLVAEQPKTTDAEPKTVENKLEKQTKTKSQGLEVFTLDSDDEEGHGKQESQAVPPENPQDQLLAPVKCINKSCNRNSSDYYRADNTTVNYYDPERKKRGYVCQNCLDAVEKRNQILISGIRDLVPLLELDPGRPADELVEISDSESEEEAEPQDPDDSVLGESGARFLEEKLCAIMNETWKRFDLDDRLQLAEGQLQGELKALQKESLEINQMLDECQVTTDKLRTELYATFECDIKELPAVVIYDVPNCSYTCVSPSGKGSRFLKRKKSSTSETPAKRSAIPLGYAPLTEKNLKNLEFKNEKAEDENPDVSVVHLSVEAAPPDLPPVGEMSHPPLKVGMTVYASKNVFGSWMKAKIVEITPKNSSMPFTMCRVKFEYKLSKPTKILPARCLAYCDPPDVRMTIGSRVIALFKDINLRDSFYSGIIAEIPNPVNNYRYLIFFDDGYAQYASHSSVRAVCERSALVWEEVQPKSRDFVRKYLLAYPERPMVRLHPGQSLKTEWRGNWWSSVVMSVDASLVEVQFTNRERREWIYRGSTRLAPLYLELQAAERHRPRALPRTQPHSRTNMPYVEYTRSDEQTSKQTESGPQQQQTEELRRQRAVAKKSTTEVRLPPPSPAQNLDNVTSRVVYYTPKKQVKPLKMVPHTCSPKCKRPDVLALKDLRTYNPLAKPLLSGWERQIVRYRGSKAVSYVSPCGRRVRDARELHRYLRAARVDLPLDLFDFTPSTHCLAEFVLNKCYVGKKDLSHGKENVPVPCVNYYDESLPEFCSYNTERTPTAGVPLNLDPEFLCGCDCEDDCEDKSKCACWKLTMEGARTIGLEGDVGYVYKRLPEPLPSGIYECNSRCKCKDTCLNRVAQHPLQLKLQVFKTLNRGWGIRALNDIPRGAFVCVYAGNLLTDATANLDGLNEGDEYLAELDYIEVVEQMKEGYEEDIPEKIKKLDKAELAKGQQPLDEEPESSSSEDEGSNNNGEEDDDFRPGYIGLGVTEFNKRLRRRDSKVDKESQGKKYNERPDMKKENDEECITISDDEEVREPSCFTAAAGMGANEFKSKYRSVRTLFGEDEACYIMDAKVQGNIGRYLNHSCVPNVFVQNVFVDTHDPRFPWVAFFALRAVRAGGELTWNYNYDVGSVPGKVLYCYCGAPACRGRLL